MIAFAVAVTSDALFARHAQPGIDRARERDSLLLTRHGDDSIQRAYNEMLDEAASHGNLEAVVLLHQDTEIVDDSLTTRIRACFADPSVAVAGPVGGRGARSLAWWESDDTYGQIGAPNQTMSGRAQGATPDGTHVVEVLDGLMMILSPWATRNVRFDERFGPYFHGYDVDYCLAVRSRDRRVLVAPFKVVHHGAWRAGPNKLWIRASVALSQKWMMAPPIPRSLTAAAPSGQRARPQP